MRKELSHIVCDEQVENEHKGQGRGENLDLLRCSTYKPDPTLQLVCPDSRRRGSIINSELVSWLIDVEIKATANQFEICLMICAALQVSFRLRRSDFTICLLAIAFFPSQACRNLWVAGRVVWRAYGGTRSNIRTRIYQIFGAFAYSTTLSPLSQPTICSHLWV